MMTHITLYHQLLHCLITEKHIIFNSPLMPMTRQL